MDLARMFSQGILGALQGGATNYLSQKEADKKQAQALALLQEKQRLLNEAPETEKDLATANYYNEMANYLRSGGRIKEKLAGATTPEKKYGKNELGYALSAKETELGRPLTAEETADITSQYTDPGKQILRSFIERRKREESAANGSVPTTDAIPASATLPAKTSPIAAPILQPDYIFDPASGKMIPNPAKQR